MNPLSKNTLKLSFVLCIALTLTSCADYLSFNKINTLPEQALEETIDDIEISASEDDELSPLDRDLEMCLDQELLALDQTGIWNQENTYETEAPAPSIIYDFPIVRNKQVEMYLHLFQNKQRKQFARWLARSTKYQALMERELAAAGLPLDLVYLSMIESGFNQRAYSKSKAVGLWQFMRATGRQYHLKVDKYVDERRDFEKSTRAAATYLSDLYKEFGDWHLAVAAYNGGPGKVRGGLRKYRVDNFWDLASHKYLRLETKRYVPKLIAAIIIAKDPTRFGFTNIGYQPQLAYDTIKVGPGMNLGAVAMISNSSSKEIKRLNQELRQNRTPLNRRSYVVNIPASTGIIAQKNMTRLHSIVSTGFKSHKIKKGETLSRICRNYGVNKTTLLKVNNLKSGTLVAGKSLRIPYSTVTYQLLPEGSIDAMAAYKNSLILHRIKNGETISKIAYKYGVPPEMIVEWNGLESMHKIRAGQQLALYVNGKANMSVSNSRNSTIAKNSLTSTKTRNIIVVLKADKKKETSLPSTLYRWYQVQNGDSLWTISRKFRTSPANIKKWNNLSSNLIHPGNKLRLKKG